MGFMDGKFATIALLKVKGPITAASLQHRGPDAEERQDRHPLQAVVRGKPAVPHPEQLRTSRSTYKEGKVVVKEKCFAIAPVDKSLAQTRKSGRRSTSSTPDNDIER